MKKYHLFSLMVFTLVFACNRPASDESAVEKITPAERQEIRKEKRSKQIEERKREGKPVELGYEALLTEVEAVVELNEEQEKVLHQKTEELFANGAISIEKNRESFKEILEILNAIATPEQKIKIDAYKQENKIGGKAKRTPKWREGETKSKEEKMAGDKKQ